MLLNDTVKDMLSDDPCNRLVAEFNQLVIRIESLENYIDGLNNKHDEKYKMLLQQLYTMYEYKDALIAHMEYLNNLRKHKGRFDKILQSV